MFCAKLTTLPLPIVVLASLLLLLMLPLLRPINALSVQRYSCANEIENAPRSSDITSMPQMVVTTNVAETLSTSSKTGTTQAAQTTQTTERTQTTEKTQTTQTLQTTPAPETTSAPEAIQTSETIQTPETTQAPQTTQAPPTTPTTPATQHPLQVTTPRVTLDNRFALLETAAKCEEGYIYAGKRCRKLV